jgi:hypothetical protein
MQPLQDHIGHWLMIYFTNGANSIDKSEQHISTRPDRNSRDAVVTFSTAGGSLDAWSSHPDLADGGEDHGARSRRWTFLLHLQLRRAWSLVPLPARRDHRDRPCLCPATDLLIPSSVASGVARPAATLSLPGSSHDPECERHGRRRLVARIRLAARQRPGRGLLLPQCAAACSTHWATCALHSSGSRSGCRLPESAAARSYRANPTWGVNWRFAPLYSLI